MKILSLNCQKGYQTGLKGFLRRVLEEKKHDFLLLQEVDSRVIPLLQSPDYKIVRASNQETGQESYLCIVYRGSYTVRETGFKSFATMRKDPVHGFKHPCPGILWADIDIGPEVFRVASIQLHSGLDRGVRLAELKLGKDSIGGVSTKTLLAGDFNSGFPGERKKMAGILTPEFEWASENLGPTLDSRYSENVAHITNRVAALLGFLNIGVRMQIDHVFVNQMLTKTSRTKCSVLPDHVSDHSPVEIDLLR